MKKTASSLLNKTLVVKPGASVSGQKTVQENVGLKKELKQTRSKLQLSIEDYETLNEELRLSNIELQSLNKELKKTASRLIKSQKELKEVVVVQTERARRQEIVADLGIYALKSTDMRKINSKAIQVICKILQIDYFILFEIASEKASLKLLDSNIKSAKKSLETIPLDSGLDFEQALISSEPFATTDYNIENRYKLHSILRKLDVSSGILINIGDVHQKLGILGLYSKEIREFSEQDIHFIQIVAHIIGSSMERGQASIIRSGIKKLLEGEVARSGQFQKDILNNSMVQRWKLGEYLHDCLAQILASIKIMVNEIQDKLPTIDQQTMMVKLNIIKSLIDKEVDVIRDLSHDIIPVGIEDEGALNAFTVLMRRTQKSNQVKCLFQTDGILDKINNRELSTSMYLIAQEAIKNAINHGKAKEIKVTIRGNREYIYLQIQDKGIGLSAHANKNSGMGLRIMRHRVELMGGTFSAEMLPEKAAYNTCISCRIPRLLDKQKNLLDPL